MIEVRTTVWSDGHDDGSRRVDRLLITGTSAQSASGHRRQNLDPVGESLVSSVRFTSNSAARSSSTRTVRPA